MIRQLLRRTRQSATTRLALSYLAIIMVLSIGFSIVLYYTSISGLQIQVTSQNGALEQADQNKPAVGVIGDGESVNRVDGATTGELNTELGKHIARLQGNLRSRLVWLNIGALIVGSVLSVYLARRTLRPIKAAIEAQARFSSDAAHELRTPLTALRVKNEVALRDPGLTLSKAKKVITEGTAEAIKLERLADSLLRLSRDKLYSKKETISLEEAANEAMNNVITTAQAKGIAIEEKVPPLVVIGEQQGLVQIITILLDNAIKYGNKDSTVYLEGEASDKYGLLHVRDTGPGIQAGDLVHIFERFYRADSARQKQGEHDGYGLGLSIAQKLAKQNKGNITVKSKPGKGSTFTIHLPLARS